MNHRDRLTSHERLLLAVSFVVTPLAVGLVVYVACLWALGETP